MKVKIENLKESQKLIKIEVDAERVGSVLSDVYGGIQKKARIPGYREGKAPRDLIETHYEQTANEETLNRLVWDCYREAVVQENLDPAGYPVIEDVKFEKQKPLTFTVKLDVRPKFKLKNYKGIKIKEEALKVTDEEIDSTVKDIQESLAQYKNIEKRAIIKGDYVVCDYTCSVDGKVVDKNDKLWLYISDQLQPKEFFSTLVGAEQDATKELEIDHPEDSQNKKLAGKKAFYKITPKQIKEKTLPEINDDLAKSTGQFKTLEELKKHIYQHLLDTKKNQIRQNLEGEIFDNLLKNHSFEVPASMVERQMNQLIESAKQRLLYQGYKKEDIGKQDEALRKSLAENAKNNVRLFFILQKVAKEENIRAEERDIDEKIEQIAKNAKEGFAVVKKRLEEKNLIENLKEQIEHDKVVKFLLNEAKKEAKI